MSQASRVGGKSNQIEALRQVIQIQGGSWQFYIGVAAYKNDNVIISMMSPLLHTPCNYLGAAGPLLTTNYFPVQNWLREAASK